jgi:hypothetical protein
MGDLMLKVIIPAALLLASSPALAGTDATPQAQAPQQAEPAKEKPRLICRDEGETGSRLAKHRTCMTAVQWKEHEQDARDNAADMQRRTTIPQ